MERDFELKKRNLKEDVEKVNIHISAALVDTAREMTGKSFNELVKEAGMSEKMNLRRDRCTFQAELIKGLFDDAVKSIIDHTTTVIKNKKVQQVDKILMVGGFSESSIVRTAVTRAFPNVKVVAPSEPGLAVLKGAVIFGHDPSAISTRVSRHTFGVAVQGDFVEGMHPEEDKIILDNGKPECKNLFSKLISVDEDIDCSKTIEKEYDVPTTNVPLIIAIYSSDKEYPIHVKECGCSKLGELIIKPPLGGWRKGGKIKIELGLGGTECTVKSTDTKTLVEQEATFDFLT